MYFLTLQQVRYTLRGKNYNDEKNNLQLLGKMYYKTLNYQNDFSFISVMFRCLFYVHDQSCVATHVVHKGTSSIGGFTPMNIQFIEF